MTRLPELHVTTWNVREKTATLATIEAVLRIIGGFKDQIICFQELPRKLLEAVSKTARIRGLKIYSCLDKRREHQKGGKKWTEDCYLAVLTDLPVLQTRNWMMSDTSKRPLITKLTIPLLRAAGKWDGTTIRNDAMFVDVELAGKPVRIITAHLSLTDPVTRRSEFQTLLDHQESGIPTIICGDLNILEGLDRIVANFAVGQNVSYALWRSEREEFDDFIADLGFVNAFSEEPTHSAGQPDHILYPSHEMKHGQLRRLRPGLSDHNPIHTRLELLSAA